MAWLRAHPNSISGQTCLQVTALWFALNFWFQT